MISEIERFSTPLSSSVHRGCGHRLQQDLHDERNIQRFSGLITDLDNTLYDYSAIQETACRAVIKVIGAGDCQSLMRTFLFSPHGVESHEAIREYLLQIGFDDETVFSRAYREYDLTKDTSLIPFPGVIESITRIHDAGIRICAVTNASSGHARDRIRLIGLQDFIPSLISPDVSGLKKPDPDMYQMAADEMRLPLSSICVVGDNLVNDIAPAQVLGMYAVYARYGDRLPPEFAGDAIPNAVIDSFSEIIEILGL